LLRKGNEVTIFEKEKELGGLLGGFKIGKTYLEKTYHHIFKTDKQVIALIKELGLSKKLKWHESRTALYYDQKIYPFMGAMDLLKFKPLNLIDKLRLGLVKIYLEKENNWQKFENVLAYEWMKKYCGKRAYRVVWEPLLKGKFGEKYKEISMAWMWARIHTRANSSEKGKEYLGYMEGGFQQIIDELEKRIKKMGGKINTGNEILDIKKLEKEYDQIISTAPLLNVDYLGAVTLVFTSKQILSPYYWHNINDLESPFLAFIQHTNLMGKKNYGTNVYYLGTYGDSEQDIKNWFKYLKNIFPDFNEKQVEKKWIFRFKYAQHIVTRNYRKKINNVDNGKIINTNFAQIYPEDRGINYAVREGEKVINNIL
jgi:protoporphyrinogen oxidase